MSHYLHHGVLRQPVEPAQYLAIRYSERLAQACAVASVGRTGVCWDNSVAE